MIKGQRIQAARDVRRLVARYIDLQMPAFRTTLQQDITEMELDHLTAAYTVLGNLVSDLKKQREAQ